MSKALSDLSWVFPLVLEPTNVDGNLNHWETVVRVCACIVVVSSANRVLCSSYMLCSTISEYVREFVCLLFVCLFKSITVPNVLQSSVQ